MIAVYALIYIPILLFVLAFLYETYLSIARLFKPAGSDSNYVAATWEVTNTLLVFGVVMLLMFFTQSLDVLASAIFTSTLMAGGALLVRAACYVQIFFVRHKPKIGWLDWLFALSHVAAALLLVVTVLQATIVLATKHPIANQNFVPYFMPGLIAVLIISIWPMYKLYRTR